MQINAERMFFSRCSSTEIFDGRTSMGSRVAVRQVIHYTRSGSYSVFGSLQCKKLQQQSLSGWCRLFCSSNAQTSFQSTLHNRDLHNHKLHNRDLHNQELHNHELRPSPSAQPPQELSLHALVDLGFSDIQAEELWESVSKVRRGGATKHAMSALTALFGLGLNPSSVLKLLHKCPDVYTLKESQLQQRIANLRKVGLVEGSLQRVVAHYPQILTVPVKTIKNVVMFLRERCLFTVQQVTDILRDSPAIVQEDLGQVEYTFQYVYFRMGVKQAEMVKSRLFRFPLDEVRCRHCFLERRGLYQTPDKKGQTTIINPRLDSILKADQDTFLTDVAKASAEEYEVFQKLLAREWHEEERQHGSIEAESSDCEDEEENEDEDEESSGRSGYRKRKKK